MSTGLIATLRHQVDAQVAELAMLVTVTGTLATGLCIAAGHVSPIAILVLFATNRAAVTLGTALMAAGTLRPATIAPWPARWLAGILALSLFVFAISLILDVSACTALLGGITLCAGLVFYRSDITREHVPARADIAAIALVCLTTPVWSWRAIQSVPELLETGIFNAWSDYFIHSAEIAQFANLHDLHAHSIFAAGAPIPLYHYASYALPASIASLDGLSSLVCATALWTPLGFLVMGTAAFTLGNELEGRAGGIAAIAAVLLLPNAAWYGLRNPYLDFHWLLQISSSGSFGSGLALLALALFQRWVMQGRPVVWVVAALLAVLVAPFRVHIAALLLPAMALASLHYWRASLAWKAVAATGLACLTAAVILISEHIPRAPHFLSEPIHPLVFLHALHMMQPNNYAPLFRAAETSLPPEFTLAVGIVLLPLAVSGILLPLYLLLLLKHRRRGDALPALIILTYTTMVLLFPALPEEPDEFQHRPFVLVYAVLAVWCAAMLLRWAAAAVHSPPRLRWVALPVLLLLPFPLLLSPWAQQSRLEWGSLYVATAVPRPLLNMTSEIKRRSAPDAIIAVPSNVAARAVSALAERALYFPGEDFLRIQSGLDNNALQAREAVQTSLLNARNLETFRLIACTHGISLIVAFPDTPLNPNILAAASWHEAGYSIISNLGSCPIPK